MLKPWRCRITLTSATGVALARSATLNRLELGNHRHDRTHKITHDPAHVEATLLTLGLR